MNSRQQSTGDYLVIAVSQDSEVRSLLEEVGRLYGSESLGLVQSVIEQGSTSMLTQEYGQERPAGDNFFKLELQNLIDRKKGPIAETYPQKRS